MASRQVFQCDTQGGTSEPLLSASAPARVLSGHWYLHYVPKAAHDAADDVLCLLSVDMGASGIARFELVTTTVSDTALRVVIDGVTVLSTGAVLQWAALQGVGGNGDGIKLEFSAVGAVRITGAAAGDGTYYGLAWSLADGELSLGTGHDGVGGYEDPCEGYVSEPFAGSGLPVVPLLDQLSSVANLDGCYCVSHRLRAAYSGSLIRVRRVSDAVEADIGADVDGHLDAAAIVAHCGASAGYIVTLYDQSGGANDLTQATTTRQPQIYDGSAVLAVGGLVSAMFDSGDWVTRSDSFGLTGNPGMDIFTVVRKGASDARHLWGLGAATDAAGQIISQYADDQDTASMRYANGNRILDFSTVDLETAMRVYHMRRASGAQHGAADITVDGELGTEASSANPTNAINLVDQGATLGATNAGSYPFDGDISAWIVFSAGSGNALSTLDAAIVAQGLARIVAGSV